MEFNIWEENKEFIEHLITLKLAESKEEAINICIKAVEKCFIESNIKTDKQF